MKLAGKHADTGKPHAIDLDELVMRACSGTSARGRTIVDAEATAETLCRLVKLLASRELLSADELEELVCWRTHPLTGELSLLKDE